MNSSNNFSIKKCNNNLCKTCNILITYNIKFKVNNIFFYINKNGNCQSKYVIYLIICNCNKLYVGKTTNQFNFRMNLHRNHIENPIYTILPANEHMRKCGSNIRVTILYILEEENKIYLNELENYFKTLIKPELNSM